MIFSLEAIRALHGDCLLLHHGTPNNPHAVLIDGGPGDVYRQTLKPRLRELRDGLIRRGRLAADAPLPLSLMMVSHIDDDHIGGLLELAEDGTGGLEIDGKSWVAPKTLWHNSFETLSRAVRVDAQLAQLAVSAPEARTSKMLQVLRSVNQGRTLRSQAETLGWRLNRGFRSGLVQAPTHGGHQAKLDAATKILVVSPRAAEIAALRKEWQKHAPKLERGEVDLSTLGAYLDNSTYNLSSIVCLAVQGEHRILLTGDARGDLILAALDAAGATTNGRLHADVLKLPHHGSIRDVESGFFERITADHYVISASGRYGNPESETLEMIAASRNSDDFTIHLTYASCEGDLGQRLTAFRAARDKAGRKFGIETPAGNAPSLTIDLGEPLTSA